MRRSKKNLVLIALFVVLVPLALTACWHDEEDEGGGGGSPTAPAPPSRATMRVTTSTGASFNVYRDSLRFRVNSGSFRTLTLRWLSSCSTGSVSWSDIQRFEPIRDTPCGDRVCGNSVGCGGESWRVRVRTPARNEEGQTATNNSYGIAYERADNGQREGLSFENLRLVD